MSRIDQVMQLHKLLASRYYPVSRRALEEALECSEATVKRLIPWCRDVLGMPIRYDRSANGYMLDDEAGEYEIPGLWLRQEEIHALLVIDHLLASLAPGLVQQEIAPFRQRLYTLLEKGGAVMNEIHRIQLRNATPRQRQYEHFKTAAQATLQRRKLDITYHSRSRNQRRQRSISPQRLTHYRDNWYLAAWCHHSDALRIFSLDRIEAAAVLPEAAIEINGATLDEQSGASYGIFAGTPREIAVIHFSPHAARWVANEQWHGRQEGKWLENGGYELRIPYSNPTELVGDILRHGAEAEVIAPSELREEIVARLAGMRKIYGA